MGTEFPGPRWQLLQGFQPWGTSKLRGCCFLALSGTREMSPSTSPFPPQVSQLHLPAAARDVPGRDLLILDHKVFFNQLMIFYPHFLFLKLPKATACSRVVGSDHPLWVCKISSAAGTGLGPHSDISTHTYHLSLPQSAWAPPLLYGAAPSRLQERDDSSSTTFGQHTAVLPTPIRTHQWRRR